MSKSLAKMKYGVGYSNSFGSRQRIRSCTSVVGLLCALLVLDAKGEGYSEPVFEFSYMEVGQEVFVIKVFENGKVFFHGNKIDYKGEVYRPIPIIGDRMAVVPKDEIEELSKAFLSLPFGDLVAAEKKMPQVRWSKTIKYKTLYTEIKVSNPGFFQ